jgi:hypothetical protein
MKEWQFDLHDLQVKVAMQAAEIERLTRERDESQRLAADMLTAFSARTVDIERLRAALEKIAGPTWVHSDEVYVTLESLQLIAREALK